MVIQNKKPISHLPSPDSQDGITLVLALVMLASVMFVSFVLSSIIIREIQTARVLLQTEPAISGAQSGGEIGLYHLLRETGTMVTSGSLVQSGASYRVSADLYDYPYTIVSPGGDTGHNEARVFLYDPTNFDNTQNLYSSMQIRRTGTKPFDYEVYSLGDLGTAKCQGQAEYSWSTCILNDPTDDRYLILLTWSGAPLIDGEILAWDEAGQPKGVPADSPSLDVVGTSGSVERRIEINLQ